MLADAESRGRAPPGPRLVPRTRFGYDNGRRFMAIAILNLSR